MKNNQPTAVLISIKEYKEIQNKIAKMERLLEDIENIHFIELAESRRKSNTSSFEELVSEEGYTMDEIKELAESVEFE